MLLTSMAPAFGLSSGTTSSAAVEAQVLTDMSHLGLDLAGFIAPGLLFLRFAAVAGRLCSMAADYIPDHTILPEEFAFQLCMLAVAFMGLVKAVLLPVIASVGYKSSPHSLKDGRAYAALFQPAGTTWADFKALSVCALDWITVEAGSTVTTDETSCAAAVDADADDEFIYWLYSGTVEVESAGELLYTVTRMSGKAAKQDAGRGLLGERRLLRRLEQRGGIIRNKNTNNEASSSSPPSQNTKTYPRTTVKAASTATLLRIHAPNLKLLMDSDQAFADSIRTLVFQGMEAKLNAHLLETSSLLKSFNVTTAGSLA